MDYFSKFKRYEILLEFKLLANNTPRHMYLYPMNDHYWNGILFLHTGLYKHAVVEFEIAFVNFPDQAPQITVKTSLHHPLIKQSGIFDHTYQFPNWKPSKDHVYHLLHYFNNSFREDVLLMINSTAIDRNKILESLKQQSIQGLGSIEIEPIDDEMFCKMRRIMFENQ
eukprot:NODE_296_length_11478_cov_0.345197.p8 type:complete len:168 gc:universal NODE_296_length_11478_cov_0.345197:6749-7252(+)